MTRLATSLLIGGAFLVAACDTEAPTPAATPETPTANATPSTPASPAGTPAPNTIEAQLAQLNPTEQRAYIAAITVRDGCLRNRTNIENAVPTMLNAGFSEATIAEVPTIRAANNGGLRIFTDTSPERAPQLICWVDMPTEDFDVLTNMLTAMIRQSFPGAERGSVGGKPAWKLPGSPETIVVAEEGLEGPDPGQTRMGAITLIAR